MSQKINLVKEKCKKSIQRLKQYIKQIDRKHTLLQIGKWGAFTLLLSFFMVSGVIYGYVAKVVKDEPVRSRDEIVTEVIKTDLTSFVYFNEGELVGNLKSDGNRLLVEYNEIPPMMLNALFAIEDTNFKHHIGIDMNGVLRAVYQQIFNEEVKTGGSTITQQLARNVFLSREPTLDRKLKEILLSMRIERFASKEQILLAYLNKTAAFGHNSNGTYTYGIKAGSKGIFGIEDLSQLSIAQMAYLVGLPQDPNDYSAFDSEGNFNQSGFDLAIQRQQLVLQRMLEEKYINNEQYEQAVQFNIKESLVDNQEVESTSYPYLLVEIQQRAAQKLLELEHPTLSDEDLALEENQMLLNDMTTMIQTGGYEIYTTIHKPLYDAMQNIASNPDYFSSDSEEKGMEQIGAMMIDNETGAILSMIEGRGFEYGQFNHATTMQRQPGSTMKPIAAFLPALEMGAISPASIVDDVPILMSSGASVHIPQNWDNTYHGLITVREAVNQSYNIPALSLFNYTVGIENAWNFAKQLGITSLVDNDMQAQTGVIGGLTHGVTIEEMTNAYASIPNKGIYNDAYMIEKIVDANGEVVYEHESLPIEVYSEETAFLMTDMLSTVISEGTGTIIKSEFTSYREFDNGKGIAGKTGSTNLDRDAWFVGYTPDITVGVWAGYDNNKTLSAAGKHRANKIWAQILNETVQLAPDLVQQKYFDQPNNVVTATVSSVSGLLPSSLIEKDGKVVTDYFNKAFIPTKEDTQYQNVQYVIIDGKKYKAHEQTPEDMVREAILVTDRKGYVKGEEMDLDVAMETMQSYTSASIAPTDMALTAPSAVDPREEDGEIPAPPTNVSLDQQSNGTYTISFTESVSPDVVGYRLYKATNGNKFKLLDSILMGDELYFSDESSNKRKYEYIIRTVDMYGNESDNSDVVMNNVRLPNQIINDVWNDWFGN
ncbi:transglycosylase domain-containing protein [Longirhabdus pacifica]|uniref:transglycosylase domain-containing protein n=1 Tax=Longirhabdus pacifica TaxID=2305227 RepID=UPI001008AED6|nr:transglycosylase domain-containing protein [Longirhabdus pacifica]